MSENRFGYDYGTKPRIMVLGDTEFPEFLRSELFTALGYSKLPQLGLMVDTPLMVMTFVNEESGRECFNHLKSWTDASQDGDAVGTGFVEFDDGAYGLCIYQEPKRLSDRVIPDIFKPEVEPLIRAIGHIREFSLASPGYSWFKSAVKDDFFLLAPGTSTHGPILDLAIRKKEIQFFREGAIPEHTMEAALVRSRNRVGEGVTERQQGSGLTRSKHEIDTHRSSQLSRFFPVTLERLGFDSNFTALKNTLKVQGYKEWQVIQAACNICVKHRIPEILGRDQAPSDDKNTESITMEFLDYLLTTWESVDLRNSAMEELSESRLREQIEVDSRILLHYYAAPGEPKIDQLNLQAELCKLGLLQD